MSFRGSNTEERLKKINQQINETYDLQGGINHVDGINLPSHVEVIDIIKKMMQLLFPGFYGVERIHSGNLNSWSAYLLDMVYHRLKRQITRSICFGCDDENHRQHVSEAERITLEVMEQIPRIRTLLKKDVNAAYIGDPAAQSHEEVILSYPAIQAIAMYRVAHELYLRKVPLVTRMISEYAHTKTGIDIHPGAKIGESFFIDHGTGVVIGETCEIGDHVKIYQMVTLGALSFQKDASGNLVKGGKRHPTIEDDVVLYAGCTILGGKTVIGRDSVIGGNVWITRSVEPGTVITFDVGKQEYHRFNKEKKVDFDYFQGSGI
ncbi:MAG: serine acetyltransferase [SAR324 cluster bacterium]|uniref:Serine acetyltransferase n=1 Tax=SAR324 cluster bacterium TaxID=2024889 RepID=A0A2A4TB35_9DELT|nr:MAG: serine acetyltransferase [SAR324 cluster bacterium]